MSPAARCELVSWLVIVSLLETYLSTARKVPPISPGLMATDTQIHQSTTSKLDSWRNAGSFSNDLLAIKYL